MKQTIRIVGRTLSVLPRSSRRFLVTFGAVMSALALLDVIALGAIAIVVPGLMSPGSTVTIPVLGWQLRTFEEMLWLVGIFVVLIIVKSFLNLLTIRIATQRFAQHEVTIGQTLFRSYMSASWVDRTSKSTQEIIRMVDSGVAAVVANVLMPSMTVVAEFATIGVISVGLLLMDWKTALATFAYLGLIALLLSRVVSPLAVDNGAVNRDNSIAVVRLLGEVLAALKELTLKGNEQEVADIVAERRSSAARTRAFAQYYNQMPRFVLDAGLVGGFVVVGGVGYLSGMSTGDGATTAMTSVALFAVAGFRLASRPPRTGSSPTPPSRTTSSTTSSSRAPPSSARRRRTRGPSNPACTTSCSRTSPSPIPGARSPPWTASRCGSPPAPRWPSWAAPARASPPSWTCSWAC